MSKIAVVGCQSSGKTVFMASLSDYFRAGRRPDQASWLVPENADAHKFTERRNYEMRVLHTWPDATLENPTSLKWSLHQRNGTKTAVEMLEFSGEVFRAAFREEGSSPQHREAADKLVAYLTDADFVVVLVGLNELFRAHDEDRRIFEDDVESTWVTRGLLDFVRRNLPPKTGVLIALTQADLYRKELESFGGAANVLKARWPMIYALYPDVPVVAVASVSETTPDGRPADGYTTEGVLPVMKAYSEFLHGDPTDLIAEMDALAEEFRDMKKACPMEELERKLARHRADFEELDAKVSLIEALYDGTVEKHAALNGEAAALVEALGPVLRRDLADRQDPETWEGLRKKFPGYVGTINAYEADSRERYRALLSERANKAAEDEERRRRLELEEKERQAVAEQVRIDGEKARTKSRVFAIRAIAVLAVVLGTAWGVKAYYDHRRVAEIERRNRVERENEINLVLAKEKEDAARLASEQNRREELQKQQSEAENRKKELELKALEAARLRAEEEARVRERELERQKAADELAAAETKRKTIEAENARLELQRKEREEADRARREEREKQDLRDCLKAARLAAENGSFPALAASCTNLTARQAVLSAGEKEEIARYRTAVGLWERALQGDGEAMLQLGDAYAKGGVAGANASLARKWYASAADWGNDEACCRLGDLLTVRDSPLYNPTQACAYYRRAAEKGVVRAQLRMGDMTADGLGGSRDDGAANGWYEKAALAHDVDACIKLARRQARGIGFDYPDFESAYGRLEAIADDDRTGRVLFELGNLYCNTVKFNGRFSIDKAQFFYTKAKEKGFADEGMEASLKIFSQIIKERKGKLDTIE